MNSTVSGTVGNAAAIHLVLVDDHRIFRAGVRAELTELAPDLNIVAEAGTVDTAITAIRETVPDVVLLDVHLPGGSGGGGADVLRGCAGLRTASGEPVRFLALSVSDTADDVIAVIRAGARGYVTKSIIGADLATAISRVATVTRCSAPDWLDSCSMPSARPPEKSRKSMKNWID